MENGPYPALSRLTGVERKLWGPTLDRQYRNEHSRYRQNLSTCGDVASTFTSVGWLWLIIANPFAIVILVSGLLGMDGVSLAALVFGLAIASVAFVRFLTARSEGKRWRLENGISSRAVPSDDSPPPDPPVGWAVQTPIKRTKRR